jgi:hypothetical protein
MRGLVVNSMCVVYKRETGALVTDLSMPMAKAGA